MSYEMDIPSDSDYSRKERRKTAAEIFFEEEPVFSDSEEEAEFLRLTFGSCEEDISIPENCDPEVSNSLSKSILKVCCRKCTCCRRIQRLIRPSEKYPAPNQLLSPSKCHNGFRVQDYPTQIKNHQQQLDEKLNSIRKINILLNHVIPSSVSSLPSETDSSNQISDNSILPSYAGINSLDNKPKRKRRKRKLFYSKTPQKRKSIQNIEFGEGASGQSGMANELSKNYNGLSSANQPDISARNDNLTTTESKNSDIELKNKKTRSPLAYGTELIGNYQQENVENSQNVSNTRKITSTKKRWKGEKKSMLDMTDPEETVPNDPFAKHKSAPLRKRKSIYSVVDKRVFKMTIDTSADRGFINAITRKLARKGGVSLGLDTFSIQNTSFRLQTTQKLKKLYSPTSWLSSPLFEKMCNEV